MGFKGIYDSFKIDERKRMCFKGIIDSLKIDERKRMCFTDAFMRV
jgi:hypothetical protein